VTKPNLLDQIFFCMGFDSLALLQVMRANLTKFAAEDSVAADLLRLISVREKELRKNPKPPAPISRRAQDVAEELNLPGNEIMLDFLSGAEIILRVENDDPETVYGLMIQAGREYLDAIAEEFKRRHTQ
jgi:hypothetical protein